MTYDKERIMELYAQESTITDVARSYAKENGIEYTDGIRRAISGIVNREKDPETESILDNDTTTGTNQYSNDREEDNVFMPSAWDNDKQRFLSIDEYCDKYNLPKEQVRSSKLVAHLSSHMIYNIAFNPTLHEQTGIDEEFIEEVVKKYIESVDIKSSHTIVDSDDWFDRLVLTDKHIGMDVNGSKNTKPLYDGKWDREELLKRHDIVLDIVNNFGKGDILIIDDLGDLMDGLGGETTRKGHHLPQNMSDKEAFDVAVETIIYTLERLVPSYRKIVVNNITNDNHSGKFSYFVHTAVKNVIERKYNNIEYNVLERFIEHYSIGRHTFLISHGKDSENLKFAFKPTLDTKQIETIDQYCKEHRLYNGNYIEFSKGDSHQGIFDDTTSNDFSYYTYPAFSPPSNWVKTNFKNSKSGFVFWNIQKDSNIKIKIPYYFE